MIFVTGGTGLLGSHLLYSLTSAGNNVRALKRSNSDLTTVKKTFSYYSPDFNLLLKKIEWIEGELLDVYSLLDALEGISQVYHCAAQVTFDIKNKKKLISTNVYGTANLINACLEKNIYRLCHVSSIGALGSSENGGIIDEQSPWCTKKQHSLYSKSKYLAEQQIWRGIAEGLDAFIVNPSVIIGPYDKNTGFNEVINKMKKGFNFYPTGKNSFVDVRDVVNIMVHLMGKDKISSERYVITSENLSYKDIMNITANVINRKPPRHKAGKSLLIIAGILNNFIQLFSKEKKYISRDFIRIIAGHSKYSNKKISKELSYEFIPIKEAVEFACNRNIAVEKEKNLI